MKLRFNSSSFFFLALPAIMLFVIACSTKKNTFTRRVYHNLTTHYNIYWNANESFKSGVADLNKQLRDNYNKILLVHNYGTLEESRKISSAMDRAIEKSGLAVQKHSLFFKKVEYNRWVDDCYMLIGKAQFYKQDYVSARRTFEFITKQYADHPAEYQARLWLIRTSLQQKKYDEVVTQIEEFDAIMAKNRVPFSIKREIPLIYADFYILNGNFNLAKTNLLQGLTMTADRKLKMRIYYILAQISQQEKNFAAATEYYTKVTKGPSSFEMAFNARINMAKAFDIKSGNKGDLEKQLKRMAKDAKNKDFLDQVYYALAELSSLDKNDTLTMQYLRLSVANSSTNDFQKTTSSLQMAELCFKRELYEDASAYYDTTLQSMPTDYPNYDLISTRTQTLSDLVINLRVVQYEDSMQKLGRLPEAELAAMIQKLVDEYNRKERERVEAEQQQQLDIAMAMSNQNMRAGERNMDITGGGGGWYFNNPSAISMGYSEFMRKWGRRKLEDNWRLSNKRAVVTFSADEEDGTAGAAGDSVGTGGVKGAVAIDPKDPKSYMQLIPKSPEAIEASNKKIADALLNLGYIYKDGLKDIPKSVASFEELLSRFPDNSNALRVYFQLYLMGKDIPDENLVNNYKAKILSGFADSDYARIIENPDYNKELLAKKNRVNTLYEETYTAFNRGQYRMVLLYSNEAISTYKEKELLPKFEYLRALSLGKLENADTMTVMLSQLVKTYPTSTVTPLAQDLIRKYGKGQSATVAQAGSTDPSKDPGAAGSAISPITADNDSAVPLVYKYNPSVTHFYIMMLNEQFVNVSATKIRISDFISKNFRNDNLSVNAILLDGGWQMITISSFRNGQSAMNFFNFISTDDYVMAPLKEGEFKHFVISMENYPIFYREKKYDGYIRFFKKNYIK
ncbi:MAG: tetratricopeptide repeat protein [Bacteroidales bacterium]|nr:tetratricopeptide repeat protein [Bacteroidales bacterium]